MSKGGAGSAGDGRRPKAAASNETKPFHNPFQALREKLGDLPPGPQRKTEAPKGPARAVVRMERKGRGGGRVARAVIARRALDVLMTTNGGRAYLFHNEGVTNHSLRIKLVGTKSNRDGIGAVITVVSGADKQTKMVRSGSSYLSQSELVATFGLGQKTKADSIEIQWPSGQTERLPNVNAGQTVTVQEGKGIVSSRAYGAAAKKPAAARVARLSADLP